MICKFCENEIPDNSVVCPECNNVVKEQAPPPPPELIDLTPPKKKSKGVVIGIVAAVTAVAVGVAVGIAMFGGNYLHRVERKAIKTTSLAVSKAYGQFIQNLDNEPEAVDGSIDLEISEKALGLLFNDKVDMSFLEDVSIDVEANTHDSLGQLMMSLKIGQTPIIDANMLIDQQNSDMYLGISPLSNSYIKTKLGKNTTGSVTLDPTKLPSEKAVKKLIDRYMSAALSHIEKYEKGYDDRTAGGISKQFTTLTVEIDRALATEILSDLLAIAKEDADLKALINGFAPLFSQNGETAYDDFIAAFEKLIADANDDGVIKLISYVDSKNQIIGRRVEFDGQQQLEVFVLRQKSDFGFKLSLPESDLNVTAMGNVSAKGVNGEMTFTRLGQNLFSVQLTDLKKDSGVIRVIPPADMIPLTNAQFEITYGEKGEEGTFSVQLVADNEMFIGINLTSREAQPRTISLPPSELVYSAEQINEWAADLDVSTVFDALRDAGVPNELLTALMLSMLQR